MAIMGCGFGLAFASMSSVIVGAVPPAQTGVASGMNANIRTIGGAIGAAVMASIVTSALAPDGIPEESGYTTGFAVLAGVTACAMLAAFRIPAVHRDPVTHAEREPEMDHAELAIVPAGTLAGADPE
jgi:MFS family permease